MRPVFYYLFIIFLFFSIPLKAQVIPFISEKSLAPSENYSVQSWTTENGLPQNSVNDIAQTKDGYLWIATFDGLVQFDGIKFKIFNTGTTKALKTNAVKRLFVDNENRLWILSADGSLNSYEHNTFKSYALPSKAIIYSMGITNWKNNSVLVGCENNKIYSIENDRVSEFIIPPYIQHFNTIISKYDDQLYIGAANGLFSFTDNAWHIYPELKDQYVASFYKSPKNDVIAESNNGLMIAHPHTTEALNIPISLKAIGNHSIGFNELKQMVITSEKGILTIAGDKVYATTIENGLSSNSIASVYVDMQNNFWIGTSNAGLNKLKKKLFRTLSKEDGMNDDGITGILETSSKNILLGNNCAGLSNYKDQRFVPGYPSLKGDCIWSLMEDKNKNIWIGSYGNGISVCSNGTEIHHYHVKEGLASNIVFSLYNDSRNTIWAGTDHGLCYFDGTKFRSLDSTFRNTITYILEDRNKQLFLCTDKGLATIVDQKITMLENGDLKNANVRYIYEDPDGVLWIGTHGNGLIRFKNGIAFSYSSKISPLDNNVWSVSEDYKGNFWLPSNSGMYVIGRKELNDFADGTIKNLDPVYLSKEDGLKSIEFNGGFQPTVLKSSSGEFWFPTVKGAAIADPRNLPTEDYFPKIIIEEISIDDKPIISGDSIHADQSSERLQISFSAPSFINPSKLNFQYKIEGIDDSWIDLGTARNLKLNSIPGGTHILRLKLAGNINNKETTLVLIKPFPFWKDTKFIIIATIVLIFILIGITIGAISFVRKREKAKTLLNKQYANIELKALQAQMNPHFIFNCLNSIQHFIILNDEVSASKYLTKFSMLMRLFLEHSKSNIVSLQEELELLRLYIELESLRFKNGFNFHFVIAPDVDIFNIEIPSMLFQSYVENAINHGLMNLDRKGTLTLSFSLENSYLIGTIEDDGVGRKKATELKSGTHKDHTSRGMEIISERISVINQMENIKIESSIIDKTNETGEATGTKIIIKIPI